MRKASSYSTQPSPHIYMVRGSSLQRTPRSMDKTARGQAPGDYMVSEQHYHDNDEQGQIGQHMTTTQSMKPEELQKEFDGDRTRTCAGEAQMISKFPVLAVRIILLNHSDTPPTGVRQRCN